MSSPRPSGERGQPLVLVVDDFRDGRELVVDLLAHFGFEIIEATNGLDALEAARTSLPNLVVLDLALPGVDGWEVARRLRADQRTRDIRLLAITAHAEQLALQRASDAGCDLVLTKPCAPDELLAAVRRLIEDRHSEDRHGAAGSESNAAARKRSQ